MARFIILGIVAILGYFGNSQIQEAQVRHQILRATVQISMNVPQLADIETVEVEPLPIPPDEYRPIARPETYIQAEGLGTVVVKDGRFLLMTHDHWSQLEADLGTVQFRNAEGILLEEMDLYHFKQLILFRDGGTMVLSAPITLYDVAIEAADRLFTAKDETLVAHRDEGRVVLSPVEINDRFQKEGVGVFRLGGQTVMSGDSGGGVWADGQLVAIMWKSIMVENTSTGQRKVTTESVAAEIDYP